MTKYKIEQTGSQAFSLYVLVQEEVKELLPQRTVARLRTEEISRRPVEKWEFIGTFTSLQLAEEEMRKSSMIVYYYDDKGVRV